MATAFVIRNQEGHFLSKKEALWLDGSEPNHIFTTSHQDIALNTLIEANSQQIHIRAEVLEVDVDNKGYPQVEISPIESKMPVKEKIADAPDSNEEQNSEIPVAINN